MWLTTCNGLGAKAAFWESSAMRRIPLLQGVFFGGTAVSRGTQQPLKKQPCAEPERGIVQTDNTFYVPSAFAVIPWTKSAAGQNAPGGIFGGEDQTHIDQSPDKRRLFFQKSAYGGDGGGTAVDREHPKGGVSAQGEISASQGAERSEDDLDTPACQTAFEKVFCK